MSLYWPGMSEKIVENEAANLTCQSAISRPPATLRLYKGTHDVTYLATTYHGDVDENGKKIAKLKVALPEVLIVLVFTVCMYVCMLF